MSSKLDVPLVIKLRLHFQLTQRELARLADVHVNSINFLERRGTGTLHLANALANVFKCSPKQLLTDEDQPPKNYDLVEAWRRI